MKQKYVFLMFFMILNFFCHATAQAPDYIIYNGTKHSLIVNPMEYYFFNFPEKRPDMDTTANWRGYAATFEIIEDELFVVNISRGWQNITKTIFDGLDKMKVDWYNGLLIIRHGQLIEYVHLEYESIYENYILIEIENGKYIREYNLNGDQYLNYRTADRELWNKTGEYYEDILLYLINESMPNEVIDYLIRKHDILKKMTPKVLPVIFENIEKDIYSVKNTYYIIFIGGIFIIFFLIVYIIRTEPKAVSRFFTSA